MSKITDAALTAYLTSLRYYIQGQSNSHTGRVHREKLKGKSLLIVDTTPADSIRVEFVNHKGSTYTARLSVRGGLVVDGMIRNGPEHAPFTVATPEEISTVIRKKIREFYPHSMGAGASTVRSFV